MRTRRTRTLVPELVSLSLLTASDLARSESPSAEEAAKEILQQREELDRTVWVNEVEAQKYEMVFIDFWDRLRAAKGPEKLKVLVDFPVEGSVAFGKPAKTETLELGVRQTKFKDGSENRYGAAKWKDFIHSFGKKGYEIFQTEWHHSRFIPGDDSKAPVSTVSFKIHATKGKAKVAIKGDLEVEWLKLTDESKTPVASHIRVVGLKIQQHQDGGGFRPILAARHGPDDWISAYPVLTYDLNGDGLSEIILPRWNRVYWNKGERPQKPLFEEGPFLDHPIEIWEAGLIADLDNDGNADFVTVGKDGMPWLFKGNAAGKFPDKPTMMADIHFDMPTVVAAGDADADGDLDLWMTQYKLSFLNGQMPTPYYDANDGYPSYYLRNNGDGTFSDITEEAGLASLRHRRTYSASFVDLDEDGDLDLMNVSDYAGLDLYENDGKGGFRLATEDYVNDRHFFGMGHTIGDYNQDGLIDFYVIGMSSTTARRLDRLKLGRDDRPDIHAMRATMGYGNRLYFGTKEKAFREDPEIGAAVARTGWSWGTTTFDFDLDGDQDIYVANGHRSGASCQDYCTTFWRHDIYTGDSKESKKVLKVFQSTLLDLNQDKISWNGFEKNVMFANNPDRDERFTNTAFMFGAAFEYDARSVVSDDFNADGKPDLIVAQSHWNGRGTELIIRAFLNETKVTEDRNWFAVHLRESKGAGYSPNGAKVAITDDAGRVQTRWIVSGDSFLCQHAPVAHFGLGDAKAVESIKVTWPNGETRNYEAGSGVNRRIILTGDNE